MELTAEELAKNLAMVQEKVKQAAERAGRDEKDVMLLPVSKTKPVEDMRVLMEKGIHAFGENYVQEIREKYETLGDSVEWHMIGHLQRNKVKYIIDKVAMIHSVDTIELAEQIEKEAVKHGTQMDVLMEVNIAAEETKWGFTADEAMTAAAKIGELPHVHLKGLMTSAPITEDPETNRKYFAALRELAGKIGDQHFDNVSMDTLSMGMTQDYETAIEEGATIVRVGTAIFGKRDYHQ
ncbi:MAG TPA: YggS family pyridoxal phosphate-dependent enzyme [Lachnospiraceae bacterium]|nr:YggS family pyridoxal phosphate-dependent enzyme [Lachnospiraceae bacterium]